MALVEHAHRGLAAHREGLEHDVVEVLAVVEALAEQHRLVLELFVGHRLVGGFQGVDVGNQALQGAQALAFTGSEDAIE